MSACMKDKDWKDWQSVCMSCEGSTPTLPKLVARFFDKSDQYWFATLANCISQLSWPFFLPPCIFHSCLSKALQRIHDGLGQQEPNEANEDPPSVNGVTCCNPLQSNHDFNHCILQLSHADFSASECDWKTCRLVIVVKGCQRHKTCIESSRCKWSASLFRIGI